MPKVFVPNNAMHDFSDAERYGDLVFITDGKINKFGVTQIAREAQQALADAGPDDFILLTSLSVISSVAAAMFAIRFKRLNLLLFDVKTKTYVSRNLVFPEEVNA